MKLFFFFPPGLVVTSAGQVQVVYHAGPKADIVPGEKLVSHIILSLSLSLVFVQIDWPAPQDKKKECAAKGKNNQVRRHRADAPLRSITFGLVESR